MQQYPQYPNQQPQQPQTPPRLDGPTIRHYWNRGPGTRLVMVGAVLLLLACLCGGVLNAALAAGSGAAAGSANTGNSSQQPTQPTQPTQQSPRATNTPARPTATAAPLTVLKLSGNGSKTSATFHVDGDWQISFTCNNTSGIEGAPLAIFIYPKGESTMYNDVVDYQCPKGASSDSSIEHQDGDVYLKIISGVPWSLTVTDIP